MKCHCCNCCVYLSPLHAVLPDYPELSKEDPTALNDASAFSATHSGHPTSSSIGTGSESNTTHQAINVLAFPKASNQYFAMNINAH